MNLEDKIIEKTAKVAVMGLGYVGLPLAMAFVDVGYQVLGYDPKKEKVRLLQAGQSDISDVKDEEIKSANLSGNFELSNDPKILASADAIIICVPTPLTQAMEPDVSYIQEAVKNISENAKKEIFVSLESTTYPGTTEELIRRPLEEQGLKIYGCYSPERVDPGNEKYNTRNMPKVIGGINSDSLRIGELLYGSIVEKVVPVSSVEVAEMSKLLENTFRSINIAFINEMAMLADQLGINIWETIDASNSKPFGFMKFLPGPGIGGHCIPLDPMYLYWKAKSKNFYSHFIEMAHETNHQMPEKMVDYTSAALNQRSKSIKESKIILTGITYKENSNDLRESPVLKLYELLKSAGAKVDFCDPLVESFVDVKGNTQTSIPHDYSRFSNYDLTIITTPHKIFDLEKIGVNSNLILDTKNVLGNSFADKKIIYGRLKESKMGII